MDVDKAVYEAFAVSVAFLVIKVLAMGPLTARQRFKHKVRKTWKRNEKGDINHQR